MRILQKLISCTSLALAVFAFSSCSDTSVTVFTAMDTAMKIQSYGKNAKNANSLAQNRIREIEKTLSVTDSQSDVYRLNRSDASTYIAAPETLAVLNQELEIASKTDGALNPVLYPLTKAWGFTTGSYQVPSDSEINQLLKLCHYNEVVVNQNIITKSKGMLFDFGAAGKGYAGDEAIKVLKSKKIQSALLDLGGNVQVIGSKPDGSAWKVGLRNPWQDGVVAAIGIRDCCMITSGGYERFFTTDDGRRYIHILDGRTGYPVENEIASATIISSSGLYSDSLSTTVFIIGKEKAILLWKELCKNQPFEMILLLNDHSICYTQGIAQDITLLEDFENIEIITRS